MGAQGFSLNAYRLFEFQLRVEPHLDDVHDEVEPDEERRVEDHGAEHEGVVAIEGAVDELAAEAGDLENGLDDKRAGEDARDRRAEKGHDGQQAAAEGVVENDADLGGAFGAGGADIILVEHLEHAAAGEAGNVGGIDAAKGQAGQHAVDGRVPAGGVEPAEVDGKD